MDTDTDGRLRKLPERSQVRLDHYARSLMLALGGESVSEPVRIWVQISYDDDDGIQIALDSWIAEFAS